MREFFDNNTKAISYVSDFKQLAEPDFELQDFRAMNEEYYNSGTITKESYDTYLQVQTSLERNLYNPDNLLIDLSQMEREVMRSLDLSAIDKENILSYLAISKESIKFWEVNGSLVPVKGMPWYTKDALGAIMAWHSGAVLVTSAFFGPGAGAAVVIGTAALASMCD